MIDHKKKYEVKQHIQSCVWIQSLSNTVKMNSTVRKWFVLAASCTLLSALFLFSFDVYVNNPGDYMYIYSNNRIINYTAKGTFDGSRKDVFQNMKRNVNRYLDRLSLDELSIHNLAISHVTRRYPTIVTAASSNHFRESMALLINLNCTIRRMFPGIKLIYFDIGLLSNQRKEVKRYCNCTFVKFPFRQFPEHVYNVKNFAWKPLIIQLTMKKHPFVLYLDASIRFHHYSNLSDLFEQAISRDILFHLPDRKWTIAHNTDVETFAFLYKNPMEYLNKYEVPAGWIFITRTENILTNIMSPWISCALTSGCFATENAKFLKQSCQSTLQLHFSYSVKVIGMCHRYEQSILSILIHDIYSDRTKSLSFKTRKYGGVYRNDVIEDMRDKKKMFELCYHRWYESISKRLCADKTFTTSKIVN